MRHTTILEPMHSEPKLPFKLVIFKNRDRHWERPGIWIFNQAEDPYADKAPPHGIELLKKFGEMALFNVTEFTASLNEDENPEHGTWWIKSVHVDRFPDGRYTDQEFSILYALAPAATKGCGTPKKTVTKRDNTVMDSDMPAQRRKFAHPYPPSEHGREIGEPQTRKDTLAEENDENSY
jgi:hypothetical protein